MKNAVLACTDNERIRQEMNILFPGRAMTSGEQLQLPQCLSTLYLVI